MQFCDFANKVGTLIENEASVARSSLRDSAIAELLVNRGFPLNFVVKFYTQNQSKLTRLAKLTKTERCFGTQ